MNPDDRSQRRRWSALVGLSAAAGAALAAAIIQAGVAYADVTDAAVVGGGGEEQLLVTADVFLEHAGVSTQLVSLDNLVTNGLISHLTNAGDSSIATSFESQLTYDLDHFTPGVVNNSAGADVALEDFLSRVGLTAELPNAVTALNTDVLTPLASVNAADAYGVEADLVTIFDSLGQFA